MIRLGKPCTVGARRLVIMPATAAFIILVFQTYSLPSRFALSPFVPHSKILDAQEMGSSSNVDPDSLRVDRFSLQSDSTNSSVTPDISNGTKATSINHEGQRSYNSEANRKQVEGDNLHEDEDDDDIDLDDESSDSEFSFELGNGVILKKVRDPADGFIKLVRVMDPRYEAPVKVEEPASYTSLLLDGIRKPDQPSVLQKTMTLEEDLVPSHAEKVNYVFHSNESIHQALTTNSSSPVSATFSNFSSGNQETEATSSEVQKTETLPKNEVLQMVQSEANANCGSISKVIASRRKKKQAMPPVSISEMNCILYKNRASYRAMRPRWSSSHDKKMLAAKTLIENAPIVQNDRELFAPAFRNISTFKRSYEMMERTLKVYVYREGQKPIFHQPLLKGIYASEGWFLKMMETNKEFTVRDPRKANMFYMPFSSRLLQFALYIPNSHNRRNLRKFLEDYVVMIAGKYPFWNRTGGADHFFAGCHDWAPYETKSSMERCIQALCNADLGHGFRLGKDVSLPQSYVRFGKDPLRDRGGRPPDGRTILAFYAGNMHGHLRSILLQHWENKDPDMKILGPMPHGVNRKMTYIQYMKSSKYCICPKGYEVNSPRVVESIFYECVPVIISDNFVPPLFEVLNWEAFSVIIPESDVPRLKEILLSISREKYLSLQLAVRKVQQHFLWHSKPVKYDAFHMVLHSIWFNRIFTMRAR